MAGRILLAASGGEERAAHHVELMSSEDVARLDLEADRLGELALELPSQDAAYVEVAGMA